jgi:uncharacterized protein (TIGR02246 family)
MPSDIRAIEEIRRRIEAGENAGDPEYCVGLLADDAVVMVPDFPVLNGRDACAAFLRELMPGLVEFFDRRITYTGSEVRVLDTIAFDRGEFAFTIRPRSGGVESRVTGKYFWLYSRAADGGWRLSRAVVTRDHSDEPERVTWQTRAGRIAFHLALPFAVFLGIAEVVRNWGDWGFWPFWVVDYLAVGLLLFGWRAFRRERAGAPVWLAGAWGFTCAMFYMSFFSHVATTVIIGTLFALTAFAFVCSLVGPRRRYP